MVGNNNMQDFFIYILLCNDGSFYVGHTDNLEARVSAHEQRLYPNCYTASRLPAKLVFAHSTATRDEALAGERQIKKWSRKKKFALINGDFESLKVLSKKVNFNR